jgi:NAD(P)-dependent dehydrogenase (short-subunit alcohol dehydrogenase family)
MSIIFITGASSGMGRVAALSLAAAGHRVFAGMREVLGRNAPRAAELAAAPADHAIVPVEIDVTDDGSVARAVDAVLAQAGQIDVLVNCAGIMWTGTTEAFSVGQFERLLQTNLLGPFRLFKAVLPGMRQRRDGLLITVTSVAGRIVPPNFGIYAASKFGLEALAEAISYETADLGIRSLILEPGPFDTGLMSNQLPPDDEGIVAQYGPIADFDRNLTETTLVAMKSTPALFDPRIVAAAIAEAVDRPDCLRHLRQPLGRTGFVSRMNADVARAQAGFLGGLGLGHLAQKEDADV